MVLVIFEVVVKEGCMDSYIALAGALREELAKAEGFIRSERFSSLAWERKLLSLSVWEDEASVADWRNQREHRHSQLQGRESLFESYTITVASPLRSYTEAQRGEAPADSNAFFERP